MSRLAVKRDQAEPCSRSLVSHAPRAAPEQRLLISADGATHLPGIRPGAPAAPQPRRQAHRPQRPGCLPLEPYHQSWLTILPSGQTLPEPCLGSPVVPDAFGVIEGGVAVRASSSRQGRWFRITSRRGVSVVAALCQRIGVAGGGGLDQRRRTADRGFSLAARRHRPATSAAAAGGPRTASVVASFDTGASSRSPFRHRMEST